MAFIPFQELPDQARLWIFPLPRTLSDEESGKFLESIDEFLNNWGSHGNPVIAGRELQYNRFLIIGADESNVSVSGCSNDGLFQAIKSIHEKFQIPFPETPRVDYRNDKGIQSVSREKFKQAIQEGLIDENTIVFNNILQTIGDYRKGLWEIPMKHSWHIDAFPIPAMK